MEPLVWTAVTAAVLLAYEAMFERRRSEYRMYRHNRRMYRLHRTAYALLWFIMIVNLRHVVVQYAREYFSAPK